MISDQKAIEAAKTISEFCKQHKSCQNCIFRLNGCDHWKCQIQAFDLQDVVSNANARKNNRGHL